MTMTVGMCFPRESGGPVTEFAERLRPARSTSCG